MSKLVQRSDLFKLLAKSLAGKEQLEDRLRSLENAHSILAQGHRDLLRRYNELEVRWPTLIPKSHGQKSSR